MIVLRMREDEAKAAFEHIRSILPNSSVPTGFLVLYYALEKELGVRKARP